MDFIRNIKYVLTKAKGAPPDAEQGHTTTQTTPGFTPVKTEHDPEKHGPSYSQTHKPIDPTDKLSTFRLLSGISSHPVLDQVSSARRLAPNLGIYTRVIRNERNAKQSFKFASLLINGCLGLQIIVAAALTAMGAANSSHGAITTFGAINTVIAGILTYLKGSGLPNRLKYYQFEWRRVREYIEQKERDFTHPNCDLDVYEVIDAIEVMYEETKGDIEANTPDGYRSSTKQSTTTIQGLKPFGAMTGSTRTTSFADNFQSARDKYGDRIHNLVSDAGHRATDTQRRVQQHTSEISRQAHDAEHEVEKARHDVEAFAKQRMSQFADFATFKPPHGSLTVSHDGAHPSITISSESSAPKQPAPTHQPKPGDA